MDFGTVNLKFQEESKKERLKTKPLKEILEFLGFLIAVAVMLFFYVVA